MRKAPKRMLLELPTADEIDQLALTTPRLEVRKFEYDLSDEKADLNYAPCKGEMVLVIVGGDGVVLVKPRGSDKWRLPSGRIKTHETAVQAAKRVAREECGISLKSLDLAGFYDVLRHYSDISVKRLHILYSAETDDQEFHLEGSKCPGDAKFFTEVPEDILGDELMRSALADCSQK